MDEQLLTAIDYNEKSGYNMMIVWDIGRRCNYDCTYCTLYMHNSWSPHAEIEELKKTMKYIDEYYSVYRSFHKVDFMVTISFTGGEPTVNPYFFDFVKWIHETYPKKYRLSMTTNATWPLDTGEKILKLFNMITVSYHTEAHPTLKEKVVKNILNLQDIGQRFKVNVMMHENEQYFNECVDLMENVLAPRKISFIPRIIGERLEEQKKQEVDRKKQKVITRSKIHAYTHEQAAYIMMYWNKKNLELTDHAFVNIKTNDLSVEDSVQGFFDRLLRSKEVEVESVEEFLSKEPIEVQKEIKKIETKQQKVAEVSMQGKPKKTYTLIDNVNAPAKKSIETANFDFNAKLEKIREARKNYEDPLNIVKPVETLMKSKFEEGKVVGRSIGRMCCGGRDLSCQTVHSEKDQWDEIRFAKNTNFQGWKCMINWFFLHIEQEKDIVFHHQTCRTSLNSVEEPIGKVSEFPKIIDKVKGYLYGNMEIPLITCPHDLCGCGMCVPKAKDEETARKLFHKYVKYPVEPIMEPILTGDSDLQKHMKEMRDYK
jgi:molybdenum cofactor biosynthesis enzyme MoaA